MDIDFELETQHLFLIERTCVVCGKQKNLIADFYKCRPDATKISSYAYECKECTVRRVVSSRKGDDGKWEYPDWQFMHCFPHEKVAFNK